MILRTLVGEFRHLFNSSISLRVIQSSSHDIEDTRVFEGRVRGSDARHIYTVKIELSKDDQGNFTLDSDCRVDCNCPAFTYYLAKPLNDSKTALTFRHGKIKGTGARVANPYKIATVCKHLYAYIVYLMRSGAIGE